jgi:putative restriction endonuclease
MWTPPEGIEVGDTLTQEEIEDAYNTGFGYRISGINPRRDDHDRQYILLFANEDGPYSDSVTQGRFEYIGEGLSGDQSEDSPGNSALIDAQTDSIPVHFFYKRTQEADWEYQSLVDVKNYEFQQRDGRELLVFTLSHRQSSAQKGDMVASLPSRLSEYPDVGEKFTAEVDRVSSSEVGHIDIPDQGNIVIGPVSCEEGTEIELKYLGDGYARCVDESVQAENYNIRFNILRDEYDSLPIELGEEYIGRITASYADSSVADINGIHVNTGDGDFKVGEELKIRITGFAPQSANGEVIEKVASEASRNKSDTVPKETKETEPSLTEEQTEFTEAQRRARDAAFTQEVRDAYDEQCAICGSVRESPDGNTEVEAAHIYPKHKGGSDDVRNGIALCKLHHWAFDTGWFSLSDEHEILVKDAPERNGYHEFKQFEGDQIRLPGEDEAHPDPMFLEEHRGIHGFTNA